MQIGMSHVEVDTEESEASANHPDGESTDFLQQT